MKKKFLISALIGSIAFGAMAEGEKIPIIINKKDDSHLTNRPDRALMRIPVEVFYDSDTRVVEVVGSESIEAEVFLYNATGTLENYSPSLNAEFYLISPGEYAISIQSDNWSATGIINVDF